MPIAARAKLANQLIVLATAGMVAAGLAACDTSSKAGPSVIPTADPDTRQVTVVGSGEVQGRPDTLTAQISIQATAPDVTAAMNQTSDRMQAVINALVNSGIDKTDIATTNVTLQPQYGGGDSPSIISYQASNSVTVKIRNLNTASQTLGLIGTTGGDATRINSVSYAIDDDSQLVRDARTRAFDDAKDRAEQYAQLAGLTLGDVISISESAGTTPPTPTPTPMPRAAMEAVPMEPGQQTVSFSVTAIWELT
ncbi:SIMPL domain-containing protein [Mycobacterium sp. ITM-2016-00318]|uniref:SIMPL domain-containing protein n=1 Tax=Mycobacterium sp. ITM-2016-00318 TaxID=2099693 RepID=UPI000CF92E44|nr:SIMPL domain-containing protein [Mycobacterium sp. ITM-2016-00318]WNG92464.1 SIMPL domain-containing protein [Mycobacterium sp. ITM-2016-00318]